MSTSPFPPADDPRAGSCGSCGAPMATDQRYCLSCGARRQHARLPFQDVSPAGPVPQVGGLQPALWSPPGGTAGPSTTTLLAALACVLLAFGVGVLVGDDGGGGGSQQPIVLGGAPAASAAAPATTTTEATASTGDDAAKDSAADETTKVDKKHLNAEEKKEATELEKTPAKVPDAVEPDAKTKKDLASDDPDKAREASQSLPDSVSTGGE